MPEAIITGIFLLIMVLGVYARFQQGAVRKVDVCSADVMQAIKRGKRTDLDVKLEAKRERLRKRMAHG